MSITISRAQGDSFTQLYLSNLLSAFSGCWLVMSLHNTITASGHPGKIHIWTQKHSHTHTVYSHPGLSTTLFLPQTSTGSSAQSLNPVAVVTLPLYTMAWWLHNVFLPVQFVAHTTAEWAGSTPSYPPTHRSMLMKSLTSPGSFSHWIMLDSRESPSLWLLPWCKGIVLLNFLTFFEMHRAGS